MGKDFNKFELLSKEAQMVNGTITNFDMDMFYWRLIAQYWAIKGGVNYFYRPSDKPYWQPGVGIEGLMPFFIDTDLRIYYHRGSVKFDLELARSTQLTNNFFLILGVRAIFATKTVSVDQIGSGLNYIEYTVQPTYRVMPGLDLYFQYQRVHSYGAFLNFQGGPAATNTYSLGFTWVF